MKYLQSDPDIAGGDLTIKGTRITIATAITRLAHGFTLEDLHESWPHVPVAVIRGAIDEATEYLNPNPHGETVL
jgi:uncharacterized protein (DUF433 family)